MTTTTNPNLIVRAVRGFNTWRRTPTQTTKGGSFLAWLCISVIGLGGAFGGAQLVQEQRQGSRERCEVVFAAFDAMFTVVEDELGPQPLLGRIQTALDDIDCPR